MNQNWIQGGIDGPMETRSYTATPEIHESTVKKVDRKQLPKLTTWVKVQQMRGVNKVN